MCRVYWMIKSTTTFVKYSSKKKKMIRISFGTSRINVVLSIDGNWSSMDYHGEENNWLARMKAISRFNRIPSRLLKIIRRKRKCQLGDFFLFFIIIVVFVLSTAVLSYCSFFFPFLFFFYSNHIWFFFLSFSFLFRSSNTTPKNFPFRKKKRIDFCWMIPTISDVPSRRNRLLWRYSLNQTSALSLLFSTACAIFNDQTANYKFSQCSMLWLPIDKQSTSWLGIISIRPIVLVFLLEE